jgi:hypothetical protein
MCVALQALLIHTTKAQLTPTPQIAVNAKSLNSLANGKSHYEHSVYYIRADRKSFSER